MHFSFSLSLKNPTFLFSFLIVAHSNMLICLDIWNLSPPRHSYVCLYQQFLVKYKFNYSYIFYKHHFEWWYTRCTNVHVDHLIHFFNPMNFVGDFFSFSWWANSNYYLLCFVCIVHIHIIWCHIYSFKIPCKRWICLFFKLSTVPKNLKCGSYLFSLFSLSCLI